VEGPARIRRSSRIAKGDNDDNGGGGVKEKPRSGRIRVR
jgi:hypothetical protein